MCTSQCRGKCIFKDASNYNNGRSCSRGMRGRDQSGECWLKMHPQLWTLSPISICWSQVQCVGVSREGNPTKHCFTLNQIEDLAERIGFFAPGWPCKHRGTRLATNTHLCKQTHTMPIILFSLMTFLPFVQLWTALLLLRINSCPVLSSWAVFTVKKWLDCKKIRAGQYFLENTVWQNWV